ncbi:CLUMA_CG001622, isoform A [Clunio marinus]|uniref:CLUMA_CG001622, isoform A n=1 Tax=Clunio marinus TaxID=568069 RepID=A0A1J1HJW0_9DIPT|nr:CLUMA_CG001622, isoform A [Clunio marinus]
MKLLLKLEISIVKSGPKFRMFNAWLNGVQTPNYIALATLGSNVLIELKANSFLPSKEPTSLTSRTGDGGSLNLDKKPFSRPFSKSRLEGKGSSARMSSPTPVESSALLRQNQELRQRLQEESNSYKRRLDTYKQAQSNQSALVSRLQAKVLQYKQRCSELENQMNETVPICPQYGEPKSLIQTSTPLQAICPKSGYSTTAPMSLPTVCPSDVKAGSYCGDESDESFERKRTDEEKKFCEQLIAQNAQLRAQLEESHRTNESLTNDLQKLTNDWESLRDEMLAKEDEWKMEEEAFNDYYNNEHSRLLRMWKEVVAVKRVFKEMSSSTKMELGKIRCEIAGTTREVSGACSGVSVNLRNATKMDEVQNLHHERELGELKAQISTLRISHEGARNEIVQRDQKLQQLMNDLKMLEDRCMQAENQCSQNQRMNEEIERLNGALRDIAHAVVQDADSGDAETTQHLHLSQPTSGGVPQRSPKRGAMRASQAFAEGTISAVQAALHKYQLSIHDLQVKLQSTKESLHLSKKQLESSEITRENVTTRMNELTEKLDTTNYQLQELIKERDSLQKTLDDIRNDKHSVERGKAELNSIVSAANFSCFIRVQYVDSLNIDYEKLQHINSKLQKAVDSLEEEKKSLLIDLKRISKDKEIQEMNLRAEEERSSRMREETITLREELNKLYLSRDLLEQQRIESDGLLTLLEKQKMDLEFEVEKLNNEKHDLNNNLEKKCNSGDNLEVEIKELRANILQLEDEKGKLQGLSAEQSNDIVSLKKELLVAEQSRLDLESEKLSISEKLKIIEIEKEKVEQDLSAVSRERGDLSNQVTSLTRKKEAMGEEILRTRQRLEQANEMNARLNRNLEELVKEGDEKCILIEAQEKDLQRLQEQLAALRSEKESLEAVLFDTNTTLEATEIKKDQLEHEFQELLVKQENLKNQVARMNKDLETSQRRAQEMKTQLTNAAATQEADFLHKIAHLKDCNEENIKKLNEEKEQIRMALEKRMNQTLQALEANKDAEIHMLKEQFEGLQMHLDSTVQQHEEVLIRAENDKQQALMLAHRDKQAVIEKLEAVSRELKNEAENCERMKREFTSRIEKDRNVIAALREDITKVKSKLEENRIRAEEEQNKFELQISAIKEERENSLREVEELKVQLRLSEDKVDAYNHELSDTMRKLRESENNSEVQRKELTDTRRYLADSNIEKEKYATSNKELRDHIKRVEVQRREQSRSIEDALQKITSLEETRNTLENDKVRLSTILKETENNVTKITQELGAATNNIQKLQTNASQKDNQEKELQGRLNNEIEEKERILQELHNLKKQVCDLDQNLHATRQELGRARCKANQDDGRFHCREQELIGRIEEGRGREKRLEDQKHNLEVCLADATQQIQELKARLGGAEGKVRALDDQLMHSEACKKDAEIKLSSIGHTLRRIAGVQLDGSVSMPYRLLSPSRRYSPARGCQADFHESRSLSGDNLIVDVDPELVRKGVRTLMHQVAQIERERDDFKTQLCTAKKQIQEAGEVNCRNESKICKMQQNLRAVQEEKACVESQLKQKTNALCACEEALKGKTEELNMLREKNASLEMSLGSLCEEKTQCEERLDKCRQSVARLESEKRHLQDELSRAEGRASKLDLQRVALEGDIQRLQMALQEKDCALKNVTERWEQANKSSAQLEDRCVALKTTIDQLKDRVQAAAITETEMKAEINCLNKERADQNQHLIIHQDKIKHIQKTLTNSENERRVLAERLEQSQNSVNELRRSQQSNQDNMQRLQEQLAEMEVAKSSLESQLRIVKWNQENPDASGGGGGGGMGDKGNEYDGREKSEMRRKIDTLNEKVRLLEHEKRYGGGVSGSVGATSGSKFSGHVQFDRAEKYESHGEYDSNRMETDRFPCGLDHVQIENECRDLRMKVRRLETLLAEKEAELARAKAKFSEAPKCSTNDAERYRHAQLQAERLLDARENSHKQQILRLENQISMLREQLAQEAKRRQLYILRSSRAGREAQQLRQTLGDSLRNVAQEPIDPVLLENETRRLDNAATMTHSLPPCYDRSSPTGFR